MNQFLRDFFSTTSWWGKILGAFFGYLIGHAPGAVIGILIGNIFDRGLSIHLSRPYSAYHLEKQSKIRISFLHTTFSILGFLAKSDSQVSKAEIEFAKGLMRDLRLSKAQCATARADFETGKKPGFNPNAMLNELFRLTQNNKELLRTFVNIQYASALCERLSPAKQQALNGIFEQLGLAPLEQQFRFYQDFAETIFSQHAGQKNQNSQHQHSRYHQTRNTHGTSLAQAYALLAVSPTATQKEVKHAYRRLISKNHPDRLMAKGLPEHVIKTANEKTQCITKAYEQICQAKGW